MTYHRFPILAAAALIAALLASPASACPNGYYNCGGNICCPK